MNQIHDIQVVLFSISQKTVRLQVLQAEYKIFATTSRIIVPVCKKECQISLSLSVVGEDEDNEETHELTVSVNYERKHETMEYAR